MYRALVSFSGVISMGQGEVREISDLTLVSDLLRAGYIEEIKPSKEEKKAESKTKAKSKKE